MKNSYEIRAQKFIRSFAPFIQNINFMGDGVRVREQAKKAVLEFNMKFNRRVQIANGSSRIVFITSDYVVKVDYAGSPFGGGQEEIHGYNFACVNGMEHLFAPIAKITYNGRDFYVMPRVSKIGSSMNAPSFWDTLNDEENDFIMDNYSDIYENNYGYLHGRWVLIDYACNFLE